MSRRRHCDNLDARITQKSIDLYKLARAMLQQGFNVNSPELGEVSAAIDRELGIRPWQPAALDFAIYAMESSKFPPHSAFDLVHELHRRLVAAAA